MKKHLLFLCVMLCNIHGGISQDIQVGSDKYLITGQLSNVPDGTKIGLYQEDGQLIMPVQQDTVANGMFTFSDTASYTKKLLILSADKGFPGNWLNVWVSPGKQITITGQDKLIGIWKVKSDVSEQQEENAFQDCAWELQKEYLKHKVAETDWFREMDSKEHAGNQDFSKQVWAKVDSIRKLSFPLQCSIFEKELDYMKTAPVGQVWMEKLVLYAQMSLMAPSLMPYLDEVKGLYANMPEAIKQTKDGQLIYQYLFPTKTVDIGDEMVDGDLYDTQGNVHRLSEFEGKYILLDFWSSGCAPCLQSIPEMDEVIHIYKDILAVVSINIDPEKAWKQLVNEKKMKGNQWNELRKAGTGLSAAYRVKGYPHYVLIAPDGKIQSMWGGYGKGSLLDKMSEYLSKKE